MKLNFLKPKAVNLLTTFVVLLLPLIRESAPLDAGGEAVVYYSPLFLLSSYLQTGDYYPFFLMLGYSLFVYLAVSALLTVTLKFFRGKNNPRF